MSPPSNVLSHSSFTSPPRWFDSYARVNKANGAKNLRCFPLCLSTGHKADGFCGSSIVIRLGAQHDPSLQYVGRLCLIDDPVPDTMQDSSVIKGTVDSQNEHVTFYSYGWRYAWVSSRSRCKSRHVFRIFAVVTDSQRVVGHFDSPSFIVCSSRGDPPSRSNTLPACSSAPSPVHKRQRSLVAAASASEVMLPSPPPLPMPPPPPPQQQPSLQAQQPSRPFILRSAEPDPALILTAIHARVQGVSLADEADPLTALLARLFRALTEWLKALDSCAPDFMSLLGVMMDSYLTQTEGMGLSALTAEVKASSKAPVRTPDPLVPDPMAARALMAKHVVLLPEGLILNGCNDVSGRWAKPPQVAKTLDMYRAVLGLSFVERAVMHMVDKGIVPIHKPIVGLSTWRQLQVLSNWDVRVDNAVLKADGRPLVNSHLCSHVFAGMAQAVSFLHATEQGLAHVTYFSPAIRNLTLLELRPGGALLGTRIIVEKMFHNEWVEVLNLQADFSRES